MPAGPPDLPYLVDNWPHPKVSESWKRSAKYGTAATVSGERERDDLVVVRQNFWGII